MVKICRKMVVQRAAQKAAESSLLLYIHMIKVISDCRSPNPGVNAIHDAPMTWKNITGIFRPKLAFDHALT
jgi:hypothetical protein